MSSTFEDSLSSEEIEEQHLHEAADEFQRRLIEKGDKGTSEQFDPVRIAKVLRLLRATMGNQSTRSMRSADRRDLPVDIPQRIGRFILGELVGEGGFGVVHRAHDEVLHRDVAIKVILKSVIGQSLADEKLVREARAAAKLNHPYLVPLYEVLDDDQYLYLVSEFCDGPTLQQFLFQHREGLAPSLSVEITIKLGQAIAHAHGRGLAHRDIKPGNVLLVSDQEQSEDKDAATLPFTPRLTDFGLVLETNTQSTAADPGWERRLAGTIFYMAPEQIMGTFGLDARRCDVYSLGLMLYQMLTGRLPHGSDSTLKFLEDACTSEVIDVPLSRCANSRDLEAVCLKALRKSPAERYESATQLVDDLLRWQEGREVTARVPPIWERTDRLVRRSPWTSALLTALVLLVIASLMFFASSNRQLRKQRTALSAALNSAAENETRAIETAYRSDLNRAFAAAERKDFATGLSIVREIEQYLPDPQLKSFNLNLVNALCQRDWLLVADHGCAIEEIICLPEDDLVVVAASHDSVHMYRGDDASDVAGIALTEGDQVHALAFCQQDERLAVGVSRPSEKWWGGKQNVVEFMTIDGDRSAPLIDGFDATIESLAFSQDGAQIAVGARYEPIAIIDVGDSRLIDSFPGTRRNEDLSFGKDLGLLWMPRLSILEAREPSDRSLVYAYECASNQFFRRFASSQDGTKIAATFQNQNEAVLLNRQLNPNGEPSVVRLLNPHSEPRCIGFSPDGRYVVAGTVGGGVLIWDTKVITTSTTDELDPTRHQVMHNSPVTAIAVDSAGRLFSGDNGGTVIRWQIDQATFDSATKPFQNCLTSEVADFISQSLCCDLSEDGKTVVLGCDDGSVWRVDRSTDQAQQLRQPSGLVCEAVKIGKEGQGVIAGFQNGAVELLSAGHQEWLPLPSQKTAPGNPNGEVFTGQNLQFNATGNRLCAIADKRTIEWFEIDWSAIGNKTQGVSALSIFKAPISIEAISLLENDNRRDDEEVAFMLGDRFGWFSSKESESVRWLPGISGVRCQCTDTEKRVVYVGGDDGRIRKLDPRGNVLASSRHWNASNSAAQQTHSIASMALCSQGNTLLTGSELGKVAIWDAATLSQLGNIFESDSNAPIRKLSVSNDNKTIMIYQCRWPLQDALMSRLNFLSVGY